MLFSLQSQKDTNLKPWNPVRATKNVSFPAFHFLFFAIVYHLDLAENPPLAADVPAEAVEPVDKAKEANEESTAQVTQELPQETKEETQGGFSLASVMSVVVEATEATTDALKAVADSVVAAVADAAKATSQKISETVTTGISLLPPSASSLRKL